jgi:hypothetical protein
VKDKNGNLLADSHNILNRRKNYFSKSLNICRVSDVKQTEIHRAELLVPDHSPSEVENTIAKLKRYKPPGSDEIPAQLIQAGAQTLWSENYKLINSIWNKEEFPDRGGSLLLYQFTRRMIKLTVVIFVEYHCYQFHTKF